MLENDYGTASYTATGNLYTITLEEPKVIFDPPEISEEQTSIKIKSNVTDYLIGSESNKDYISSAYLTNSGWVEKQKYTYETAQKLNENDGKTYYKYRITDNSLPQNTYIKIITCLKYGSNSSKMIFYNGSPSSGSTTDKLIDMGDSFLVTSDRPVYICTASTMKTYDECRNWTAQEWETRHLISNEHLLDFSANSGNFRMYSADTSVLNDGEYYVVIAHFADGHTLMSQVMEK